MLSEGGAGLLEAATGSVRECQGIVSAAKFWKQRNRSLEVTDCVFVEAPSGIDATDAEFGNRRSRLFTRQRFEKRAALFEIAAIEE